MAGIEIGQLESAKSRPEGVWANTFPSDDRLLKALEAVYDAAPDPLQWPLALGAIADCFADVGAVLLWRRDDGSYGSIVSERLVEAQDVLCPAVADLGMQS